MLGEKYINPFTDFGFKKIFGTEPNKDLLINFLNHILPPQHKINELYFSPNEVFGYTPTDRKAIFDLYCTSDNGDKFIVEMQKAKQNYFKDRSVYYSSFPIQEQAKKKGWDYKLSAVYTIGILDFTFDDNIADKEVVHTVQLKDHKCRVFYDKLTYIYLEMPNFNKDENELETDFDKWLYVIKNLQQLDNIPHNLQNTIFEKLFDTAEIANFSKQEKYQYEESLKYYRDLKNVIDTGKEEARLEEKYKIAAKALGEGFDVELVSTLTGLSIQEVELIKNKKI